MLLSRLCRLWLLLWAGVFASGAAAAEGGRQPGERPNVILIYSDDHGWADLGAQGVDPDIRTPNLDALARDGVRFARGYVSAPQCVPSRAGVITGRYQQRFGVDDNLKGPLPLAERTIAERLQAAGYVSGQVGKWHLEPPPRREAGAAPAPGPGAGEEGPGGLKYLPLNQGFAEYATGAMNAFVASHDLQGRPVARAPQRLTDPRFRCVWQADAAISFVERHRAEPFFLYLAFYTPHVPLESPEPWFSRTPARLPLERRQALAMIAAMDDGIGRLRERLRALGIERNTLIFFIGDNGAPVKPGAWDGSLNLPLIGEKGMLTDGGVRTPFVAAWPGTLPAGRVYEPAVSALDVAATAVALAGLPDDAALDGVNLVPFLTGRKTGEPHDALFWRWRSQAAVLSGKWKLILLGPDVRYLFDTTTPEGETRDLKAQHPEIAERLLRRLRAWDATLLAPGLPSTVHPQDQEFFRAHADPTLPPAAAPRAGARKKAAPAAPKATPPPQKKAGWTRPTPELLTLDNGAVKVGIDRAMGASLTWLSWAAYPKNMINVSDPGRLIQQSYYAGRSLDRKADGQSPAWSPWTWNPIQGGGVGSWARVTEFRREGAHVLYSETVPKLWDMPDEEAAARMRQWTAFEPDMPNVVVVRCEFVAQRDEGDRWGPAAPRPQEVPACYFTRNFSAAKSYLGGGRWRDESQPPGPPWGRAQPPCQAMAFFNAAGQGVAVFSPAATQPWNFGPHGAGASDDPAAGPCMHVAPLDRVKLGPRSTYRYRYWLVVGDADAIAARLDALAQKYGAERAELLEP